MMNSPEGLVPYNTYRQHYASAEMCISFVAPTT
jgi:hypothetical protein